MKWSDLIDQPDRLQEELDKLGVGLQPIHLMMDIGDVDDPDVQRQVELAHAHHDTHELLRIALVWFGDEGNPQPTKRTKWADAGQGWWLGIREGAL